MIRVVSKKSLGFRNIDDNSIVTVRPLVFAELPDWVVNDPLYRWATADGTLEVVEPDPVFAPFIDDSEQKNDDSEQKNELDIDAMSSDELKALATERGIEIPRGFRKADLVKLLKGE